MGRSSLGTHRIDTRLATATEPACSSRTISPQYGVALMRLACTTRVCRWLAELRADPMGSPEGLLHHQASDNVLRACTDRHGITQTCTYRHAQQGIPPATVPHPLWAQTGSKRCSQVRQDSANVTPAQPPRHAAHRAEQAPGFSRAQRGSVNPSPVANASGSSPGHSPSPRAHGSLRRGSRALQRPAQPEMPPRNRHHGDSTLALRGARPEPRRGLGKSLHARPCRNLNVESGHRAPPPRRATGTARRKDQTATGTESGHRPWAVGPSVTAERREAQA